MFAPLGVYSAVVSKAGQEVTLGVAALGALFAGVRALGTVTRTERERLSSMALLTATTAALVAAWGVFGVLTGTHTGMAGAALLAANMAICVPLLLSKTRAGILIGALSMLGLPPFGGFVGALLVATAAIDHAGAWLALLLFGTSLAAVAWLQAPDLFAPDGVEPQEADNSRKLPPIAWLLILAQFALTVLSISLASVL